LGAVTGRQVIRVGRGHEGEGEIVHVVVQRKLSVQIAAAETALRGEQEGALELRLGARALLWAQRAVVVHLGVVFEDERWRSG
jgi:hypothetical protein